MVGKPFDVLSTDTRDANFGHPTSDDVLWHYNWRPVISVIALVQL